MGYLDTVLHWVIIWMFMSNELYSDYYRRLDTIIGDADFWYMMRRCRETEGATACETNTGMFVFFRDTYGIQLRLADGDRMENISKIVDIVDEQKYMLFLLKYTR